MASGSSGASTPTSGSAGQWRHEDIFISSTRQDLAAYRVVVSRAITLLNQHIIGMEDFGARTDDAVTVSLAEVGAADLVLLILAWRYGYVPAGETRSVTHLEYLEARRLGKPVLVFLAAPETEVSDDTPFPHDLRDAEHHTELLAFRAEVERSHVAAYFSTPDELYEAVIRALNGWLRGRPIGRAFPRVLPEAVRDFVGREAAVAQVLGALRGGRNAAISALVAGMGGVGKSALAGEVLRRLASDPTTFPGGITLVRCNEREGLPGLAWIYDQLLADWGVSLSPQEVAATQNDPEEAALARERALHTRLRLADESGPLPALVLLDNVEEKLPLGRALSALGQAGLTALVTARHVPTLPNVALLRLDVLDPGPAAALFAARFREAGGQWDNRRDAKPTRRIVDLLGGLPLAIELAAADAALEGQGIAALAEQLAAHDRLDPLSDPTDPTKSVRYAITLSFKKLTEPLQAAFAALGLPAGNDWPRDVIAEMLSGTFADVADAPTPAEALRQLAARSLLTLISEPPPAGAASSAAPTPRVRLHPLLREYADEQYAALPADRQVATLGALMGGMAAFTLAHAEPTAAAFAILAREEPLIAATVRAAAEAHAAPQALIAAVRGIGNYAYIGGHWQLGIELLSHQLDAYHAMGDQRGEGRTLGNLGALARHQGRYAEATHYYTEALAVLREIGDRTGEGTILNNLGALVQSQGRHEEAIRYCEEALAIRREVGDRHGEGVTLNNLGELARDQGRLEEAARYYEEALTIIREVGDRAGEGAILDNLGQLVQSQGRHEEAIRYCEEALAIRREVGDRAGEATTLHNLGMMEAALGHRDRAESYFRQSLAIYTELGLPGDVQDEIDALARLARAAAFPALPSNPSPTAWPTKSRPAEAPTPSDAEAFTPPPAPSAEESVAPTPQVEVPAAPSGATSPTEEPVPVGSGKPRRKWWPFGRG